MNLQSFEADKKYRWWVGRLKKKVQKYQRQQKSKFPEQNKEVKIVEDIVGIIIGFLHLSFLDFCSANMAY